MTRVEGSWRVVVRATPMTVLPEFPDRTYDTQTVERFIACGAGVLRSGQKPSVREAQNMAGYITTRSGLRLAYALMVEDVGVIQDVETGVAGV
jgi:hypothetical protein